MAATSNGKFVGNILPHSTTPDTTFSTYWNQITPENSGKWGMVEGTRDVMNWTQLDYMYNLTRSRGIPFKHHTFVWGQQYPSWITSLSVTEQREEVEEWIAAFAARYPDTEYIDVVNEPLVGHAPAPYAPALGGAGTTGWDWVIWSFEKARQYFPNAKLLLNDYSILSSDTATTQYLTIINLLKDRGLIDGIGEQAHFYESTSITTIQNNLNRLAATGLPIYISELDISIADDTAQLNRYQTLFPVFWTNPAVRGITFWGYKPGMWRADGNLLRSDGTERPALTWLKDYIAANPQSFNAVVTSPANGQAFREGSPVSASATVTYGTAPFTVTFQKKLSSETEFTTISSDNSAPYTAELGVLPIGTYQIRTIVTDGDSATVTSSINTFEVTQPPAGLSWDGGTVDIAETGNGSSGGGDGTWNTTTKNWDQGNGLAHVAWSNTNSDTAIFGGTAGTVTLGTGVTVGGLNFDGAYTVTGNTVTFGTSGTISNSATVSIASVLAGTGPITKTNTGSLRLANTSNNTFSGGLTIHAGTVFVNTASTINALSSGKITIGNAANTGLSAELLYSGTNGNNSFSNAIDVRGNGAATIRVVGYNPTFSGAINLANNLSVISNNSYGSNITFTSGVTGTGNLVIQSNAANGTADSFITFQTNPLNFTGTITNSGTTTSATDSHTTISATIGTSVTGITQNSANSALILSGANTFTGNISITAGTLSANRSASSANPTSGALGNAQALGRTVTISNGGTLNFNLGDVLGNGASTPKLTLIANGGIIKNTGSIFNVLGPVQLNGGTLSSVGGSTTTYPSFALTGAVTIGGSAVSTISSTGTNSQIGLQTAGTTFDVADVVSGSDLNVTGVLGNWNSNAGSLIKGGPGTMTLSNTNTYAGNTRIDNGTLALGASGSIDTSASVTIKAGATLNTSAKTTYTIPSGKPVTFGIDPTGSGSCGKITAAGLNVSSATVTYDIVGPLNDPAYVLATYTGTLGGTFLSAPAAPAGYSLNYAYEGNKIALVQSNTAPSISNIADLSVPSGGNTGALVFTISDEDLTSVIASGSSSNTTLVPNANIIFGGSGASRTVTVTPVSGLAGSATITITVTDNGSLTAQDTFVLTVTENYLSWTTSSGLTAGNATPTADPDGDSLTNLQEFAFGMDPTSSGSGPITYTPGGSMINPGLPVPQNVAAGAGVDFRAVFGRRKDYLAMGLNYTVQFSADMSTWTTSDTLPTVITGPDSTGVVEAVSVPYPLFIPVQSGFKKPTFFRVGVSSN